jgi:Ala-tRNA(Pro) deacylase
MTQSPDNSTADETPSRLADGGAPATPEDLLARLRALGIAARTIEHPRVFTVEESKSLRGQLEGGHTKNLFLRNKKGVMWLVTCLEDRQVDLKTLGAALDMGRPSFGSADRLMRFLGVVPGAVTPFAVLNDTGGQVRVALDRRMMADHELLNFHPLDNAMTTTLSPADLRRFLDAVAHPPVLLDDSAFA